MDVLFTFIHSFSLRSSSLCVLAGANVTDTVSVLVHEKDLEAKAAGADQSSGRWQVARTSLTSSVTQSSDA